MTTPNSEDLPALEQQLAGLGFSRVDGNTGSFYRTSYSDGFRTIIGYAPSNIDSANLDAITKAITCGLLTYPG